MEIGDHCHTNVLASLSANTKNMAGLNEHYDRSLIYFVVTQTESVYGRESAQLAVYSKAGSLKALGNADMDSLDPLMDTSLVILIYESKIMIGRGVSLKLGCGED